MIVGTVATTKLAKSKMTISQRIAMTISCNNSASTEKISQKLSNKIMYLKLMDDVLIYNEHDSNSAEPHITPDGKIIYEFTISSKFYDCQHNPNSCKKVPRTMIEDFAREFCKEHSSEFAKITSDVR